jgi:hypothetical protein
LTERNLNIWVYNCDPVIPRRPNPNIRAQAEADVFRSLDEIDPIALGDEANDVYVG